MLIEALSVAGVAAISYVSTNFDNLVVLSAYGAKPGYRSLYVKLTFIGVCVTVLFVSLMLAQAADNSISAKQVRYLGLIPIALGFYQLLKLMMNRVGGKDFERGRSAGSHGLRHLSRLRLGAFGEQQ